MKKNEYQKFQDFMKRHKLTYSQIIKIMSEYANTVDEMSASFFSQKHAISKHVFYKMRDYTIIFMLVDSPVCKKIRDKAFRNQGAKNPDGSQSHASSFKHYYRLLEEREKYLKGFSKNKIVQIATDYAEGRSLYDIANKHRVSVHTVRRLLAISLVNRLISAELYYDIKFRSDAYRQRMKYFSGYTAEELWNWNSH